MQFELSARYARFSPSAHNFQEVWISLCHEFLSTVFPSSSIVRMDSNEYGIDLLDQTTGSAYCCHAVDEPSSDTLSVDRTVASLEKAAQHRDKLRWQRYSIATNAEYSKDGMDIIKDRIRKLQIASEEVGFLGPATWNRLCSEYPRIVDNWFEYRIIVSKDVVKKAFEDARYYPKYVAEFAAQIDKADFKVVLTNNRTPIELVLPFAPQLKVKNLLDIGKVLLDLNLDATDFRDLSTSASLSVSVIVDDVAQEFSTQLADVPISSGGEAQIWIKIVWQEKSFDQTMPSDGLPTKDLMLRYIRFESPSLFDKCSMEWTKEFILGHTPGTSRTLSKTASVEEQTLARKEALVISGIWQKIRDLLPAGAIVERSLDYARRTSDAAFKDECFDSTIVWRSSDSARRTPVRLGASAPKAVAPGSSFAAHFVAYHPDLEAEVTKQISELDPKAMHRLDAVRTNWKIGAHVKVKVYGNDLIVDPEEDEFEWGGEMHILDFRVNVGNEATGSRDLKFDVYVENLRLKRIWMPLEVSSKSSDELQKRTVTSPRTAFASYASEDRPRVLDRVATLEIHCGLQVFLDCISMRPNAKWRELLPEMVLESDQLLLFWSKAAMASAWVEKEWRIAFNHKGIDGIEIHPLCTYKEAKLPKELAYLVHGADPLMVIRAHEEQVRTTTNTQDGL